MLVLLAILAGLQYRWLGEVSDAEMSRMQARMQASAARFARDFDRELTRALVLLGPGGPPRRPRDAQSERHARWMSSALMPDLVRGVFVASGGNGQRLQLLRVDEETGGLVPTDWPQELLVLRSRLESAGPVPEPGAERRRTRSLAVAAEDVPALVIPYFGFDKTTPDTGYTIVWLDEGVIQHKLLPELATRHFAGADGLEYRIEISSAVDPKRVTYHAGPGSGERALDRSDAEVALFGLLRADELDPPPQPEGPGPAGEPAPVAGAPPRSAPPQQWRLRLAHPSGSLEAAVSSTRHRNLAISFGTLLLLALGMTMLLLTTRRAQRLAIQQLEFTAGVTHELATPLAGMRSAAQNLADGVVRDPAQVREYGSLIDREGRRLTEMVEQVLAFAGMQSGRVAPATQSLAMRDVIEDALAYSRRALDEKGFRVETEILPDLPDVRGDGPALRRAIENLIGNAVKYAADGSWLGVRAGVAADRRGRWLTVTVEDAGPGISAEDLPRVFEPFYRGRGRAASAVPGSGLGLTVVRNIARAHGGHVDVTSAVGKGASFRLLLPLSGA
jgi:signal transduction histidine kinase